MIDSLLYKYLLMDSPSHSDAFSSSCAICYNKYDRNTRKPCTLVCGHTLCIPCVKESDKCPICKKKSGEITDPQPNYEMMNVIDQNNKYRLKWLEAVKCNSPEFWNSVKSEEEKFIKLIKNGKMRYEKIEKEMNDQKEMVVKSYSEYIDKWQKCSEMLVQSKKDENKLVSDLKEKIKQISCTDSLLKILEDEQSKVDDYLRECNEKLEKFSSDLKVWTSSYQNMSIDYRSIQNPSVSIQIYQPLEVKMFIE